MVPTLIQGAAMAFFFIPLITIEPVGPDARAHSGGVGPVNFARITAGSFGTSISTTLWDRRATLHHAQLVGAPHAVRSGVSAGAGAPAGRQAMSPQQSYAMLNRLVDQQAFMLSANDIFYVSAVLFLVLIARGVAGPARTGNHGCRRGRRGALRA